MEEGSDSEEAFADDIEEEEEEEEEEEDSDDDDDEDDDVIAIEEDEVEDQNENNDEDMEDEEGDNDLLFGDEEMNDDDNAIAIEEDEVEDIDQGANHAIQGSLESKLFKNILHEKFEKAKRILQSNGTELNINWVHYGPIGHTLLTVACKVGNLAIVDLLLEYEDIDINKKSINEGRAPIVYAIIGNHIEVVRQLICTDGINEEVEDRHKNIPFHFACAYGSAEMVNLLYKRKRLNWGNRKSETPSFQAAMLNNREGLSVVLRHRPNLLMSDRDGATPLWIASYKGHIEVVKLLLSSGLEVGMKKKTLVGRESWNGTGPIEIAMLSHHKEIAQLLRAYQRSPVVFSKIMYEMNQEIETLSYTCREQKALLQEKEEEIERLKDELENGPKSHRIQIDESIVSKVEPPNTIIDDKQIEIKITHKCFQCQEEIQDPVTFECFHTCCARCRTTTDQSQHCPICQEIVTTCAEATMFIKQTFDEKAINYNGLTCEICDREELATEKCQNCQQYFCNSCKKIHLRQRATKKHSFIEIGEKEKAQLRVHPCPIHHSEELDTVCEQCKQVICPKCAVSSHKKHSFVILKDYVEQQRQKVTKIENRVKQIWKQVWLAMDWINLTLTQLHTNKDVAESLIKDSIAKLQQALQTREQILTQALEVTHEEKVTTLRRQSMLLHEYRVKLETLYSFLKMVSNEGSYVEFATSWPVIRNRFSSLVFHKIDLEPNDDAFLAFTPNFQRSVEEAIEKFGFCQ